MKLTKSILSLITIVCFLISQSVMADCNFKTDIAPGPNKTFIYSEACHLKVGQMVQDAKTKTQQLDDLTKAISLKDLALQESDKRATLWNGTASKLEDRLQKVDSLEKKNEVLYFGLGVLTTFLAAYAAAKLVNK